MTLFNSLSYFFYVVSIFCVFFLYIDFHNYLLENISYETFHELVGISQNQLSDLVAKVKTHEKNLQGAPRVFSTQEEVLLTLLWLRHHCVDLFLAAVYKTGRTTIQNIRKRMLTMLSTIAQQTISTQTLEWRLHHSCTLFHDKYTFIVDGSEQKVKKSKIPATDIKFFSAKKKQHSINILIVRSVESPRILYLSPSYAGSVHDINIVRGTRKEWYDLFDKQERGMGDAGFNGLLKEGIQIDTPPADADTYKVFSSKRILVENSIAAIKDWRACRDEIQISPGFEEHILDEHNKCWKIAAMLLNEYQNV